jgi:hypothetical protein
MQVSLIGVDPLALAVTRNEIILACADPSTRSVTDLHRSAALEPRPGLDLLVPSSVKGTIPESVPNVEEDSKFEARLDGKNSSGLAEMPKIGRKVK